MSTKTSIPQSQGRRTPLSLNPMKQTNKTTNDNNKKDTTSIQKTDNSKKDSQLDKKPSLEKKMTDNKKPSTSEAKKLETPTKNEDNKKNGVSSSNGVKDKEKQTASEGSTKAKTDASSNGTPNKKDVKNQSDKKKETEQEAKDEVNKTKEIKNEEIKIKETKNEDNKKQKANSNDNKKQDEIKEDLKEIVQDKASNKKQTIEEKKISSPKASSTDKTEKDNKIDEAKSTTNSPQTETTVEEKEINKTPTKEIKKQETPKKEENQTTLPEIDDVEMMEPLTFEPDQPIKINAASTPASKTFKSCNYFSEEQQHRTSPKSEVKPSRSPLKQTPDRKSCPRTFSAISGRRSIRPIGDYTFSGNFQIRESYRKINTELDFTSSSMNVTVGSEVPNNDSFSFFSRSRKRDRSSQSTQDVQPELSPKSPKRARIELGLTGIFNVMASPITMLRNRLARATVQSTPKKQIIVPTDDDIVENVSSISVEEEITTTEELPVDPDSTVDNVPENKEHHKNEEVTESTEKHTLVVEGNEDDLKIKETILATTDVQPKKKCTIM